MAGAPRLVFSGEGGRWLCRWWGDNAALLSQAMTRTHAPTQLEPGCPAPDSNMPRTGKAMRRVYAAPNAMPAGVWVGERGDGGAVGRASACISAERFSLL